MVKKLVTTASVAVLAGALSLSANVIADDVMHMHSGNQTVLTEAGQDAFGTIQEVITALEDDPHTDWSQVNLEALRQHLLDMQDMTLHVDVLSSHFITNGLEVEIMPTTERSMLALQRVLAAHPAQLKNETGWNMQVTTLAEGYRLIITTDNIMDVDKIRGLGYIGLMAYGGHHQQHHWMLATGRDPHS